MRELTQREIEMLDRRGIIPDLRPSTQVKKARTAAQHGINRKAQPPAGYTRAARRPALSRRGFALRA